MGFFGGGGGASNFSELAGTAAVNQGGTGATTAVGARTNLGAQEAAAILGALATLDYGAANKFLKMNSGGDGLEWAAASAGGVAYAASNSGSEDVLQKSNSAGELEDSALSDDGTTLTSALPFELRSAGDTYGTKLETLESDGWLYLDAPGFLIRNGGVPSAYFTNGNSQIRNSLSVGGSHAPAAGGVLDVRSTANVQIVGSYSGTHRFYLYSTSTGEMWNHTNAATYRWRNLADTDNLLSLAESGGDAYLSATTSRGIMMRANGATTCFYFGPTANYSYLPLRISQSSEPSSPVSGTVILYLDSADDILKYKLPGGTVRVLDYT